MRYWYPLGTTRWFGASLHVHLSVLVAAAVLALTAADSPIFAVAALLSLLALILLHEFGHAWVAHTLGYSVHGIWFGLIHGRCTFDTPETEWDRCLIAWGGVSAQLLIAVPICLLDALWHRPIGFLGPVVLILGYWSLVTIVYNLIPSQGFDGKIAWRILPLLRDRLRARRTVRDVLRRNRGNR
jgi:stage IV sporulation protein FB